MAYAVQLFESGASDACMTAIKDALSSLSFFDSVTLQIGTVTATKGNARIAIVAGGGSGWLTFVNSSGTTLYTASAVYGGTTGYPASVLKSGKTVAVAFSGLSTGNPAFHYIFINCDTDEFGLLDEAYYWGGGSMTSAFTTMCSTGVSTDTTYGLNLPLSRAYTYATLYNATAPKGDGGVFVFDNVYGARVTTNIKSTFTTSAAWATPTDVIIDGSGVVVTGAGSVYVRKS